jgi:hypothetical protein
LIAFSSSRTYHRLAVAIEDAGAVIRDQLLWIYGTGFPKSPRDITAAIDRNRDDDPRPVCRWLRAAVADAGRVPNDLDALFGTAGMAGHWCATDANTQPAIPTPEQWRRIVEFLAAEPPEDVAETFATLSARKGTEGEAWGARPVVGEHATPAACRQWVTTYDGAKPGRAGKIRAVEPVKADASPWVGWATALRPSHEPAVMARKRFTGPAYRNVLAHGTGAINVNACWLGETRDVAGWPPNVLLSADAAADLDAHVAGAARYFYADKASTDEREAGLEAFDVGPRWNDGRKATDKDYPSHRGATDRRNMHPTVKPIDVMRWLVRLVTPPGGVVLDPYAGSGTTGIACVLEGFGFVGVDLDSAHVAIATARCEAAAAGVFDVNPETDRVRVRGVNARRQITLDL